MVPPNVLGKGGSGNQVIASSAQRAVNSKRTKPQRMGRILIFICLLLTVFLPAGSAAQQAKKLPRIGFLQPGVFPPAYREEFRKGLRQLGYVEGENILVEYRLAKGLKELPTRIAELV